ncbi:DUF1254 domain-containing protein [Thalassotalea psychrophila]|uniref:DUF1254 domain-containing protein n=1 Tax=Thalassotalea psychrophila TaxID=3065647 RepID=A0ABY9TYF2_9GAMM|nr:DUF1254 domain-containing protein [Colwelliaceae bacterium SQ149]
MNKLVLATAISASLFTFSAMAGTTVSTSQEFFADDGTVVTTDNYATFETSRQLIKNQELAGINKLLHKRQLTPTDNQPVVRMNRDTYYSMAVVDVSKGAYISMPEIPEGKYMSVQPVTEDHRIQAMMYGAGTFNLTTHTGTHMYLIIRLDSTFTEAEAKEYQDQMMIKAKSNNKFTSVQVNEASFTKTENALKAQTPTIMKRDGADATYGMFTDPRDSSKEMFTKEKYSVGAALGWGGAQLADNIYEISGNYPMEQCHQATFADPENNAFWSFTVYDKKGFMFNDVAHVSSNTAKPNKDGTFTLSFGCGSDAPNNIDTENDSGVFNLAVRHYIPSDKVKNDGYRLLNYVEAK